MYWIDSPRDHKRSSHLVKLLNVNHQSLQGSRGGVVKYAGRVMGLRQTEELPRVQHGNVMRGGGRPSRLNLGSCIPPRPQAGVSPQQALLVEKLLSWREYLQAVNRQSGPLGSCRCASPCTPW